MENIPESLINPIAVANGITSSTRDELCQMISVLVTVGTAAQFKELYNLAAEKTGLDNYKLEKLTSQVEAKRLELINSDAPDEALGHQLWTLLQNSLGVVQTLPLSNRSLEIDANALGFAFAKGTQLDKKSLSEQFVDWMPFGSEKNVPAFGECVHFEAARLLGEVLQTGLPEEDEKEVLKQIRIAFASMPEEFADDALRVAVQNADPKAIGAILAGGSVAGLALAVEIAGFAAYILAAQLSAVIPVVGGLTMTTLLAVLVNPITVILAVGGGGIYAWQRNNKSMSRLLARRFIVVLALKGSNIDGDLAQQFGRLSEIEIRMGYLGQPQAIKLVQKLAFVRKAYGANLPSLKSDDFWSDQANQSEAEWEKMLSTDTVTSSLTGGLTASEMLYLAWSIDPKAIEAVDFSRAQSIDNVIEFSGFASRWAQMSEASQIGLESNLQGYVAEQLVLTTLVSQGLAVELPAAANTQGYDLLVDGVEVQVKCGQSLSLLTEHFEKYPDIPVIANSELILEASKKYASEDWLHMLHPLEGFELEVVQRIVENALENGNELLDNNVAVNSIFITVGQQIWEYSHGRLSLHELPIQIAFEAAIKGAVAWVGASAGQLVGIVAFGPAGPFILGPVGGVAALFGVGAVRGKLIGAMAAEWWQVTKSQAETFKKCSLEALDRRIDNLRNIPQKEGRVEAWLRHRRNDDLIAALEARHRLKGVLIEAPENIAELLLIVADIRLLDQKVSLAQVKLLSTLAKQPNLGEAAIVRFGDAVDGLKGYLWKK